MTRTHRARVEISRRRRAEIALAIALATSACVASWAAPVYVAPGEGPAIEFVVKAPPLKIRSIAIDGHVACEPETEGHGFPPCGATFSTRVVPGKHYLQVQVTRPDEPGHKDAEERVTFDGSGRYVCTIVEHFVTTKTTAVDQSGFPEPKLECAPASEPAPTEAPDTKTDPSPTTDATPPASATPATPPSETPASPTPPADTTPATPPSPSESPKTGASPPSTVTPPPPG